MLTRHLGCKQARETAERPVLLTPAPRRGGRRAGREGPRVAGEGGERGGVAPHAATALVTRAAVVAVQQRRGGRGRGGHIRRRRTGRVARGQAVGVGRSHESVSGQRVKYDN